MSNAAAGRTGAGLGALAPAGAGANRAFRCNSSAPGSFLAKGGNPADCAGLRHDPGLRDFRCNRWPASGRAA